MILQQKLGLSVTLASLILIFLNLSDFKFLLITILSTIILGYAIKGPEHHLLYTLSGGFLFQPQIQIQGFVKQGYESVKQEFVNNFQQGLEQGAQFTAYVNNEKVVDLWGSYNLPQYNDETLHTVFSCTKNIETLVIGMLVDKGLLDYEQKISKYWPEFAQKGKENITLQKLMRHESGLSDTGSIGQDDIQRDSIKNNQIGQQIEKMAPKWNKNTVRSYHTISRGYILNEIVRRVDTKKRTIGEFVEEEIRKPLGLDFWIGVEDDKLNKFATLVKSLDERTLWCYIQGLVPNFISMKSKTNILVTFIIKLLIKFNKGLSIMDFNSKLWRKGEAPSANGSTNSKSLAKLANLMAQKGEIDGKRLLSKKTWEIMHSEPIVRRDSVLRKMKTQITKGGFGLFDEKQERVVDFDTYGFYGWQGYGGSIMYWHPEAQIGCAYVLNFMECDISNLKGQKLRKKVYDAAQKLQKNQ